MLLVEALWQVYKCVSMPHHAQVSANYLIHLLCVETIPVCHQRVLKHIEYNPHAGHSKTTTLEQKELKKSWVKLSQSQLQVSYNIDPRQWTCNCGSQKYNPHLLCKHLVQSVPMPHTDWWPEAIQYSVPPFYIVPGVVNPLEPEKIMDYGWYSGHSSHGQLAIPASVEEGSRAHSYSMFPYRFFTQITSSPQKKTTAVSFSHPLTSSLPGFTSVSSSAFFSIFIY
jgi:hypothetical protein